MIRRWVHGRKRGSTHSNTDNGVPTRTATPPTQYVPGVHCEALKYTPAGVAMAKKPSGVRSEAADPAGQYAEGTPHELLALSSPVPGGQAYPERTSRDARTRNLAATRCFANSGPTRRAT
jgi:hypothetical protein